MPARKGTYNARAFHKEGREATLAVIDGVLGGIRPGTVFRNVSNLAEYVAERCGTSAGNLRRNPAYRARLETHVASQKGAVGLVADSTQEMATLKAKLLSARLELSNARADKRRLELYIQQNVKSGNEARLDGAAAKTRNAASAPDFYEAFVCTATALVRVLENARVFEVDVARGLIINRAERPGSLPVVGSNLTKAFIAWYIQQLKDK
ncbi:hypothetical protein EBE87_21545 [Pseudoroseomonas wenyumeiae]|uniref:Uncharacterized protein n=1 Tax=Teichococcus wenyumeiae TaxID=2478470 RepID=A0A3A9JCI7_9PROT|nr:hypothetical protein [Pseudoroseomonas wenyumeiae]RKK03151.1 hypothetical protein D6Z83_16050 [Pseudoroseomonas wenyumeiae]RMI19205.1 hypothetical protein EBE87_21545 [Pseudoroseomonas wenyumeiae]